MLFSDNLEAVKGQQKTLISSNIIKVMAGSKVTRLSLSTGVLELSSDIIMGFSTPSFAIGMICIQE